MRKILTINHEKCTACRRCELACSLKHAGEFSPAKSRVTVAAFLEEDFYMPVTCLHCEEPLCREICPAGAIAKDQGTGAVTIDPSRCVGCRMCVMVCPFGAVASSFENGQVVKCDLCGGEPECAAACVWGALEYTPATSQAIEKRKAAARRIKDLLREVSA